MSAASVRQRFQRSAVAGSAVAALPFLWALSGGRATLLRRARPDGLFSDVFDLMDRCRFRDCKHEHEPGCAVLAAIADGTLDKARLEGMHRLVAEEAALERTQQRARRR